MTIFAIRDMTLADLDDVGEETSAGGFGDRRDFFRRAMSLGDCHAIVAVSEGRIVGTGLGAVHGRVGWLGVVFVVPELRRRGIGRTLAETLCEGLQRAGCRSLVLVATDLGRPVYDKLGFREQSHYHMFSGEPLARMPTPPPGAVLSQIRPDDVDAIAALDRRVSGEDRMALIRFTVDEGWLIEDEPALAVGDHIDAAGAGLRGYILPTSRGNAAIVAHRPDDAACLLDMHRYLAPEGIRVWAGVLTENEAGRKLLVDRGWYSWRSFPRMVLGEAPEWEPDMIWGQFNHAMG